MELLWDPPGTLFSSCWVFKGALKVKLYKFLMILIQNIMISRRTKDSYNLEPSRRKYWMQILPYPLNNSIFVKKNTKWNDRITREIFGTLGPIAHEPGEFFRLCFSRGSQVKVLRPETLRWRFSLSFGPVQGSRESNFQSHNGANESRKNLQNAGSPCARSKRVSPNTFFTEVPNARPFFMVRSCSNRRGDL